MGFLLPLHCGGCHRPGWALCPSCRAAMRPAPAICPLPAGLETCRALLAYEEGPARTLIAGLKYGNHRSAVRWLVEGLSGLAPPGAQLVTWAPTATGRRRERGYDQARVIAGALAKRLGLPLRAALRRGGEQVPQTGLDRSARLANPAFEPVADMARRVVVVIDDVLTTGSTLQAAGLALRRAGASEVHGLTVAATPGHGIDMSPTRSTTALARPSGPSGLRTSRTIGAPAEGPRPTRRHDDLCA